jgi:type II secretory pathway pseudopilin PulG
VSPLARMIFAIVAFVLLGALAIWFLDARSEARELERRQEALSDYRTSVDSLLQALRPTVAEMHAVPTTTRGQDVSGLEENAPKWSEALQEASNVATTLVPAPGSEPANRAFQTSVQLYIDAANLFGLVADTRGDASELALLRAQELRGRATSVWETGVEFLDDEFLEADLDPTELASPAEGAGGAAPIVTPPGGAPGDDGAGDQQDGRPGRQNQNQGSGEGGDE